MTQQSAENKPSLASSAVAQEPKVMPQIYWALVWFAASVLIRLLVIPLAGFLDASHQYLLVWPVSFGSTVVIFSAALWGFTRFFYRNTLFKDSGTRFNTAFSSIRDPFKLMIVYAIFLGPVVIALAILAATVA